LKAYEFEVEKRPGKHVRLISGEYCVSATLISNLVDAVNATQAASHPTPTGHPRPLLGVGLLVIELMVGLVYWVVSSHIGWLWFIVVSS